MVEPPNIHKETQTATKQNLSFGVEALFEQRCRICLDSKPFQAFHQNLRNKSGIDRRCKICVLATKKAAYHRHRYGRREVIVKYEDIGIVGRPKAEAFIDALIGLIDMEKYDE